MQAVADLFTAKDIIGVLAFVLNVLGNLQLAYRSHYGWWTRLVAIVVWGVYAVVISNGPLLLNSLVFFGINSWGVWQWRKTSH